MLLVDSKLKKVYSRVLENTDDDDDDILAGLDVFDQQGYLRGHKPYHKIEGDQNRINTFKVDLTGVTPGSLTDEKLLRAFKLIVSHTPPPWQNAIQVEVNKPVTVKIGRNTLLNNKPAYKFSYNLAKNSGILTPTDILNIGSLEKTYKFTPTECYLHLSYTPHSAKLIGPNAWSDLGKYIVNYKYTADYDKFVVGTTASGEPMGYGSYGVRVNRKVIVFGPIQSIEYRDLYKEGILYDVVYKLAQVSRGKTKSLYNSMLRDISFGEEPEMTPAIQSRVQEIMDSNAHKIGIDRVYDENL
jgi:hypothetical protein